MRTDLFQHEMRNTSAVLGRVTKARVTFSGDQAMTNGSTVVLPEMALGKDVDEDTIRVMRGYVDHEAGHLKHSDMGMLHRFYSRCNAAGRGFLKELQNALEDCWMEPRVIRDYPGAEKNLRATDRAINGKALEILEGWDKGDREKLFAHTQSILPSAVTWAMRAIRGYASEESQRLLDMLDPDVRDYAEATARQAMAAAGTKQLIQLALEVEQELLGPQDELPEFKLEAKGMKGMKGEPGDGAKGEKADPDSEGADGDKMNVDDDEGDGEGEGDEDDGEEKDGEGSAVDQMTEKDFAEAEEEEDTRDAEVNRPTPKSSMGTGKPPKVFKMPEIGEEIGKRLDNEGALAKGGSGQYLPPPDAKDRITTRHDERGRGAALKAAPAKRYDDAVMEMGGEVRRVKQGLERALMSKTQRDWSGGHEYGRMDTRRLTAAMAGRQDVFKLKSDRVDLDTATTLLVDLSGSMSGGKARLAQQSTIAMVEALDKAGIPYEVLGFTTLDSRTGNSHKHTRIENLETVVFKAFNERLFEAKGALSMIAGMTANNNVDGESVMIAYDRLAARPERRKVLFVLSDGNPACYTHQDDVLEQHLRDTVKFIEAQGTEVMAIGIQDSSVKRFYRKSMVVSSLEELARVCVTQLGTILLGR